MSRTRFHTGAVHVSTLGKNEPKIDAADGLRYEMVEFAPEYSAYFGGLAQVLTLQKPGWIAEGVTWGVAAIRNHVAAGAGTTVTVELQESSVGAADEITLCTTQSIAAVGDITTTALEVPTTEDRVLNITFAGTLTATPVLTLFLRPTVPARS